MASHLLKQVHRDQLHDEIASLHTEFARWLKDRGDADARKQYTTQLKALDDLIGGALIALRPDLDACDPALEMGTFYERCRQLDGSIVLLRRVWQFFRDKFDQRDDARFSPTLQVADEIVWSCYRPLFESSQLLGAGLKMGPAPLPFIEPRYAPEAFPSELVPDDLKEGPAVSGFIRTYLNKLPLSVVRLPPACVLAPWTLVLIGHETGHHIQYDLDLVGWFRKQVGDVVREKGATADEAVRWQRWSEEIFADIFSVVAMGSWALMALAELILSVPETMLTHYGKYPAPALRLQLMAETAARLGINAQPQLQSYALNLKALLASKSETSRAADLLPHVITLALGPLPLGGLALKLADLFGFRKEEFAEFGAVQQWSAAMLASDERRSAQTLRAPRLLASASLHAWSELARLPDARQRIQAYKQLAKQAVESILRNHETAQRDVVKVAGRADIGTSLADLLRQATRMEREGAR